MYNVKTVGGGEILNLDGPLSIEVANAMAADIETEHNIDVRVVRIGYSELVAAGQRLQISECEGGSWQHRQFRDVLDSEIPEIDTEWDLSPLGFSNEARNVIGLAPYSGVGEGRKLRVV